MSETNSPTSPATTKRSGQLTRLELYLAKLRSEKDTLAISLFWEKMGASDRRTRSNFLSNPGLLRVSKAIELAKFLSEHFSEVVTPESLSEKV